MANTFHQVIALPDRSYQAIARAELKNLAVKAGFTGHRLAEVEIIIAEITTNLIKHATHGGRILCRILEAPDQGMEIIAIDDGPGIALISHALKDGISSKKTLGQGLGAIKRLSDLFDHYSLRGWGTILLSRIFLKKKPASKTSDRMVMETLRVAKNGENACGDNWVCTIKDKHCVVAMVDGLGHGPEAEKAAKAALEELAALDGALINEHIRKINNEIKKTRGVVMSIAYIDSYNKQLTYCGVGNILSRLIYQPLSSIARTFNSYNGIVGHTIPTTINNTTLPWDNKLDMLVMHSDGITGRWDLNKYPKILQHNGMILCAAIYKDHNRGTDDSTVSVIRYVKNV